MKKLVTMFLAVALCMGLAVPAMATSTETLNGVTITNVVRQETKNVTFMDYEYVEENGNWHNKEFLVDKEITVYYVAGSTTISVSTGDSLPGESAYMLEDGVYVQCGGGAASWGWDSTPMYGEDEVNVIYAVVAGIPTDNGYDYTEALYYAFDNGTTPSESEQPAESGNPFTDVASDAYYADAVKWAVEKNITAGTTATTFAPNNTCTTAQILTFLWRANGSPAPAGSHAAVPTGKYYTDAANWALEKGLTDAFSADTPATRAATVTYLWKLAGKPAADAAAFTDVDAGAEYAQAVAWAVKEGITSGTSATTFAPDNTCTRGQIVTFLYRDMAQ